MKEVLYQVMTASEADEFFDLPIGTVKRDCNRKVFNEQDCRKSKSTWLITKEALVNHYQNYKSRKSKGEK